MRFDGVDILRGLAIFLVLMNHVNMRLLGARVPYTAELPAVLVPSLVWNGQFGVQIFFAVSGFLITSTTLRRWGSLSSIGVLDFYRLRFARIAPLLFLVLAVLSILHWLQFRNFIVSAKTGGLGRALLAALTFRINVLEANRGYLPGNWDVLWSLSVEEAFYLFFPVVSRIFGQGKLLVAFLLALVVLGPFGRTTLAHGNEIWSEYSYLGRTDAIALGCLTALIVSRTRFSPTVLRISGALGIVILAFMLGFSNRIYSTVVGRSGFEMTILAMGTCMVIAAAAQTQWKSPGFLGPVLKLGRCSYEVYLTHMFVVFALFNLFLKLGKPMAAVPILFVGVIVIASVCGAVTARVYSEPMNRLLRKCSVGGPERLGSVIDGESAVPSSWPPGIKREPDEVIASDT
jgi:peptidoglycan/LPS O-acetylase OafA/YrhL